MCVGSEREPKGWRELGAALAAAFGQQELWSQSFVSNQLYCSGDNPVFGEMQPWVASFKGIIHTGTGTVQGGSAPGARRAEVRNLDVHLPQCDRKPWEGCLSPSCSSSFLPSLPS